MTSLFGITQQVMQESISKWATGLVSYLTFSLTLKTEAASSSEMSVDFQRARRRYIPEDRILLSILLYHHTA
jgi:hypothetical protein